MAAMMFRILQIDDSLFRADFFWLFYSKCVKMKLEQGLIHGEILSY